MSMMGERTFFTRNRRDQPPTTLLDEFVDGRPTGRIVRGYRVGSDGAIVVDYLDNTATQPDMSNGYIGVQQALENTSITESVREAIREGRAITAADIGERRAYRIEELSQDMVDKILNSDISHLDDYDYNSATTGISQPDPETAKVAIDQAVAALDRVLEVTEYQPPHKQELANKIWAADDLPLVAPAEDSVIKRKLVGDQEQSTAGSQPRFANAEEFQEYARNVVNWRGTPGHHTAVYILEFQGPYGTERVEFASIQDAQAYPSVLTDYFKREIFSDFQLFREYRTPREKLNWMGE